MEYQLNATRMQFGFSDEDDGRLRALAITLRRTVLPMLIEYFHDDWRKVDFVFACMAPTRAVRSQKLVIGSTPTSASAGPCVLTSRFKCISEAFPDEVTVP